MRNGSQLTSCHTVWMESNLNSRKRCVDQINNVISMPSDIIVNKTTRWFSDLKPQMVAQ